MGVNARLKFRIRTAVLSALLFSILLVAFTLYYWPIGDAYYPFNYGWNGCSTVFMLPTHASLLYSYTDPLPAGNGLLAIIGPRIAFSADEAGRIHDFLTGGGTVLLADDYGTGNSLLQNLNVTARFSGKAIADLYFYSKETIFPVISQFQPNPLTNNLTSILMAHPSYIENASTSGFMELAESSPFSFIDNSGNGTFYGTEATQSYPVMASTRIGSGVLVLVSNADLFANELIDQLNNTILFRNLLSNTSGTVVFDMAHVARARLTDIRAAFRSEVEGLAVVLQSTFLRTVITLGIILAFSGAFLRRRSASRLRSPSQSGSESTLHSEPLRLAGGDFR